MQILRTRLCVLEPQTAAHAAEMFGVLADPAIYEFENTPPPSLGWLTERYARLESRRSADGREQWLNWVIRLPGGELAGYVQATVSASGTAFVAYELASRHWRQGIGGSAVAAMIACLRSAYGVDRCVAVLKAANFRSAGLLRSLGFDLLSGPAAEAWRPEPDEVVMAASPGGAPGG